jgi:N-acetylmuramic acid 6-phosphate etherase
VETSNTIFEQLKHLTTEQRNFASMDIDARSITEALTIINSEDIKVAYAVQQEIPHIAKAVELVVHAFKNGGRRNQRPSGRVGCSRMPADIRQ